MSISETITTHSRTDTTIEVLIALAVVVLTILGLAAVAPSFVVAVATIIFGLGLLLQGRAMAGDISRLAAGPEGGAMVSQLGMSGWSAVLLAGIGGIVLGILALLHIAPPYLVAIAIIGFGGALLVSSNSAVRLRMTRVPATQANGAIRILAENLASDTVGTQMAAGLAAVVLGILALSGFVPLTLELIALLALGTLAVINSAFIARSVTG
jgi:hypothetical protein